MEMNFNPNWWHQTAGIAFDRSFYFDPPTRIQNDVIMRRVLYECFGEIGVGDPDPQPVSEWQGREVEGVLYVPKAGETLYRPREKEVTT